MAEPTSTSVYLYYDPLDVLIYVGITSRGTARQAEHVRSKPWWPFVARQDVEHYLDRDTALRRERELVTQRTPPFNVQMNPHHAAVRAAYLQAAAATDAGPSLRETLRGLRRALPLLLVSREDRGVGRPARLVLRTPADLTAVARVTTLPRVRAKVLCDGQPVGEVSEREYRGGYLWLTCTTRRDGPALHDLRAQLRVQSKPLGAEIASVLATRTGGAR